jgi:hypothetical protein
MRQFMALIAFFAGVAGAMKKGAVCQQIAGEVIQQVLKLTIWVSVLHDPSVSKRRTI